MNWRSLVIDVKKALARSAILLVLTLVFVNPLPVYAQQEDGKQQSQRKDINKAQAAERARQQVKGRVLKVEKKKNEYRVKVLQKSGRVVSVDVDKNSGRVKNTTKKKNEK
jgi:hypothetical protein